jgi:hypothetical protein
VAIEHGTRLFRTLFISDVHLGARGCRAERLLDFQRYYWSAISSAATDCVPAGIGRSRTMTESCLEVAATVRGSGARTENEGFDAREG